MARQIGESLQIANESPELLMNSKGEWGTCTIPRVIMAIPNTQEDNPPEPQNQTQTRNPSTSASTQVLMTPSSSKRKREESAPPTRPSNGPMDRFLFTRRSNLVMESLADGSQSRQSQAEPGDERESTSRKTKKY